MQAHHPTKNISLALPLHIRVRDRVRGAWHGTEWCQPLVVGLLFWAWLMVILVVILAVA